MAIYDTSIGTGEAMPDPVTASFALMISKSNAWRIFPYGEWTEGDGSRVIFDRQYRPICRIGVNGSVEIVPPETWINYTRQRFFHRGFGPRPDAETRAIVLRVMQSCHGMESELRRRRDLEKRRLLPRRATVPSGHKWGASK